MDDRELERKLDLGRLLDFYGPLLTERRREIVRMYCEEDMSLAEISETAADAGTPVTRQGVYDAVAKSEKLLRSYEDKLQLMAKCDCMAAEAQKALNDIDAGDISGARARLERLTDL